MKKSENFIERRILWAAGRHNLPSENGHLYQDIELKNYSGLELRHEEHFGRPVYFFFEDEKNWTTLGTRGICGVNDSTFNSIEYTDIQDLCGFDKLKSGMTRKEDLNELKVITSQKEIVFKSMSGGDFFALWNICLMLQRIS